MEIRKPKTADKGPEPEGQERIQSLPPAGERLGQIMALPWRVIESGVTVV